MDLFTFLTWTRVPRCNVPLVPTISFGNASFQLYGKSLRSTDMGGDLIDVIESDGALAAYVADISGHGRPAHESVDHVPPDLKQPEMFATLA